MSLSSNHYTQSQADTNKLVRDIWTKEYLLARENNLVTASKAYRLNKSYLADGQVYNIPGIGNVTPSLKVAGSAVNFIQPTETPYSVTVNKHYEVSFLFEDEAVKQSYYDLQNMYAPKAAYALAEQVDTHLNGLYSSWTTTDAGTAATALTKTTLLTAQQRLNDGDVPASDRCFIIAASQYDDLMGLSSLTYASNIGKMTEASPVVTGGKDMGKGYLMDFFGDPIYISNNIIVTGGTDTHNLYFHKEAMVLAMQIEPKVVTQYHADYLGTQFTMHELYGYNVLRTDHGVEVLS